MLATHNDKTIYFHEIINAMSYALDLTEGQPAGHSLRSCWIGMHLGQYLNLSEQQQHDLYYTLILKDAGCSSNAARLSLLYGSDDRVVKNAFKTVDNQDQRMLAKFVIKYCGNDRSYLSKMKHIMKLVLGGGKIGSELISARCERGASIARKLGLSEDVALGIYSLDEHYNGKGLSQGLKAEEIPLYSRIALLSQVIDVFFKSSGIKTCCEQITKRSGSWFDPVLIGYFKDLQRNESFWDGLNAENLEAQMIRFQPKTLILPLTFDLLDNVAETFGQIIDAKSPFTNGHSKRVAFYVSKLAEHTNFTVESKRLLYPAALLHDVGKLGVGNHILDKPGSLEAHEWAVIQKHPAYTEEILSRFLPFHSLARIAAAHHERLDGTGYFKGTKGDDITPETRLITIGDIFDALTAERPYRGAMPVKEALKIMDDLRDTAIDSKYMDALHDIVANEELESRNK
ncbi:MAG TPA: HD domain-containing phosphohydrolase [Legionella sp.]|nr:HD domain-containing phosphohydrolase [Legionella sp.]